MVERARLTIGLDFEVRARLKMAAAPRKSALLRPREPTTFTATVSGTTAQTPGQPTTGSMRPAAYPSRVFCRTRVAAVSAVPSRRINCSFMGIMNSCGCASRLPITPPFSALPPSRRWLRQLRPCPLLISLWTPLPVCPLVLHRQLIFCLFLTMLARQFRYSTWTPRHWQF